VIWQTDRSTSSRASKLSSTSSSTTAHRRGQAGADPGRRPGGVDSGQDRLLRGARPRTPLPRPGGDPGRARRAAVDRVRAGARLGNVAVGSVIAPLGPERGSGEVLTLTREQDGWTPGVKLTRPIFWLWRRVSELLSCPTTRRWSTSASSSSGRPRANATTPRRRRERLSEVVSASERAKGQRDCRASRLLELERAGEAELARREPR